MDDALLMGGVDGAGQPLDQPGRFRGRLRRPAEPAGQGGAVHQLQGKEG